MTTNPSLPPSFATRLLKSLGLTKDAKRWEQLVMSLLRRLELDAKERDDAEREYLRLADRVAIKLDIPRHDVKVYPQGSIRTQTTIAQRGNAKFDLDVVFELSGPKYQDPSAERMFAAFGEALKGDEATTGEPEERRRCWRLRYPNKPFYFDVTPAVADLRRVTGAGLRVRDPETVWSPSNPEEFAQWFCDGADLRFPFQVATSAFGPTQMRKSVDPLPDEPVGIDDILRRTVQLMKLHRDNFYHLLPEKQKETMPISVIIVTLATLAYENLWKTRRNSLTSPIEVVLTVVEEMPRYIERSINIYLYRVSNPKLPSENFADRWNKDQGVRAREFKRWHAKLEQDLEALLTDEYSSSTEAKLRSVFGQAGVDAWRKSIGTAAPTGLLVSLLASPGGARANPTTTTPLGRKDSLA